MPVILIFLLNSHVYKFVSGLQVYFVEFGFHQKFVLLDFLFHRTMYCLNCFWFFAMECLTIWDIFNVGISPWYLVNMTEICLSYIYLDSLVFIFASLSFEMWSIIWWSWHWPMHFNIHAFLHLDSYGLFIRVIEIYMYI